MIKRYKYRAYPTTQQQVYFQKIFGSCRFIYNWGLDLRIKSYQKSKDNGDKKPRGLSCFDVNKILTEVKKEDNFEWLNDVPSICLIWSLKNLDYAFSNFFRVPTSGFPKFKSKNKSEKSFTYHQGYKIDKNKITVPKGGWLKFVKHREFVGETKSITIIQDPSGKYYVSIIVDDGLKAHDLFPLSHEKTIGIDVGVVNTITLSDGKQFKMDVDFGRQVKLLAKQQQKLSRKVKGSRNFGKQKIKIAVVNERIRFKRDFEIKYTCFELIKYLIDKGCTGIAIRKYDIKSMVDKSKIEKDTSGKAKKGHRKKKKILNRHILNASMGMVCTHIKNKCLENGINVLEMNAGDQKTTYRCSVCQSEDVSVNLKTRNMKCNVCGHECDMDINASINTLSYCLNNTK